MIRTFLRRFAAVAALVSVTNSPALAQRMGSTNKNAPAITQSIELSGQTIGMTYTAITWAGGQWATALADEATRGEWRTRINDGAVKSPLGSFKCSTAITIGETKVAAGAYKLAFTLDEKFVWQLALIGETATVNVALSLKEVEESSKRLGLSLRAGDKDGSAEIAVAFGKSRTVLAIAPEK